MEVIEKIIPYKRSDEFHIYPLGDIHAGTVHCAEGAIKKKVAEIKADPMALWIGMGDYGEFITPKDPRWDPAQKAVAIWIENDNIVECQRNWIVDLFEPIKDKCIGLLYGNHEESIRRHNHVNVQKNICNDLGIQNLGYSCFVRFIFRRGSKSPAGHGAESHMIRGHFEHGTGGARTDAAKLNYLKRSMESFDADLYAYAHVHSLQTHSPDILSFDKNLDVKAHTKVGALTGCWFRTYTKGTIASYGEQKSYSPSRIGCPVFVINPDKGILKAEG